MPCRPCRHVVAFSWQATGSSDSFQCLWLPGLGSAPEQPLLLSHKCAASSGCHLLLTCVTCCGIQMWFLSQAAWSGGGGGKASHQSMCEKCYENDNHWEYRVWNASFAMSPVWQFSEHVARAPLWTKQWTCLGYWRVLEIEQSKGQSEIIQLVGFQTNSAQPQTCRQVLAISAKSYLK